MRPRGRKFKGKDAATPQHLRAPGGFLHLRASMTRSGRRCNPPQARSAAGGEFLPVCRAHAALTAAATGAPWSNGRGNGPDGQGYDGGSRRQPLAAPDPGRSGGGIRGVAKGIGLAKILDRGPGRRRGE